MQRYDLDALGDSVANELAGIVREEVVAFRSRGNPEEAKGSQDLVTMADRNIEERLVSALHTLLPESTIRGEEGVVAGSEGARFEWVLDPIDGTVNFARGVELFTSVVALLDQGRPVLAVVYLPEKEQQVLAVKGGGCKMVRPGLPMIELHTVHREKAQTVQSLMITPKLSARARDASLRYAMKTLDSTLGFRVFVSQAYEAASLASAGIDAVISLHSSGGWSRDAARLICEESGGEFRVLQSIAEEHVRGFVLTSSTALLNELANDFRDVGYVVVSI